MIGPIFTIFSLLRSIITSLRSPSNLSRLLDILVMLVVVRILHLESVEYLKILRSKSSQDLAIYTYRRWIKPPFIDPHWEARGDRLNGLCEAKMFIVRNEFRERRALGVAAKPWGGVKFRQRCWHDEGGPRLEASLQASSLIHTSAPLVSSLISGTESWRTLSSRLSHDFERFGEAVWRGSSCWTKLGAFFPLLPSFN